MRLVAIIFLALLSTVGFCGGYGGATGKNALGENVIIDESQGRYFIYVQPHNKNAKSREYDLLSECPGWDYETRKPFSCQASGKSPLAGATYKITTSKKWMPCKDSGEDQSHAAGTVYICIKGCNNHTPKVFYQQPWEC